MYDRQGHYPTWVRVLLFVLTVLGVAVGIVVGSLTYATWSEPDDEGPATTTTLVVPEEPEPPDTLG
jgi:hypothetical protein